MMMDRFVIPSPGREMAGGSAARPMRRTHYQIGNLLSHLLMEEKPLSIRSLVGRNHRPQARTVQMILFWKQE
jgi:hypothetical protein